MSNEITIPEQFLHCKLMTVAVHAQAIIRLRHLTDEERQTITEDMVARQLQDIKTYEALG